MSKKDNTTLYVGLGVAAVAAAYLMSKGSAATVATPASNAYGVIPVTPPASSPVSSGGATTVALGAICPTLVGNTTLVPLPPAVFSEAYFMQYQYPPLCASNPNLLNSNYQLSQSEITQLAANYVDVAQGVKTWTSNGGNFNANMQSFWKQYGVAQHRVFVPFEPTDTTPYVAPPASSTGKTSSTLGTILTGAASIIAVLGIDRPIPQMTDLDLETLTEGSAVAKEILPMFYNADPAAKEIDMQIDDVLTYYFS